MKPLSRNIRKAYLLIAFFIFIFIVPLLILYASGYRFQKFELTEVGGLYITAPLSRAEIYVNNELVKRTSAFQKNVFIQSLKPGVYDIKVTREESQPWSKKLKVVPKAVTEAHSFLLPTEAKLAEIPRFIVAEEDAPKDPERKENSKYKMAALLFDAPPKQTPELTETFKIKKGVSVENREGILHAEWTGNKDSIPSFFCESEICQEEIIIKMPPIESFDFFPERNNLLVVRTGSGIYVVEIDNRSEQNVQTLVLGPDLDFRVKDEDIYLKKDGKLYTVSLN